MLDIRGFQKFSLVEWPGKMSAIIFTGGCNFRCPFCHNPELVIELDQVPTYPWQEIEDFLNKKVGWIDAIIITGGEPTIHPELPQVFEKIKNKGYLTGIATNGTNPEMLKELIEKKLLDKIAMDIKSSPEKYDLATGRENVDFEKIKESISLIKKSGIAYDFKITLAPDVVKKEDMVNIGNLIRGAGKVTLQQFRPLKTLDKNWMNKVPYAVDEIKEMKEILEGYVDMVSLEFIE